MAAFSTKCLRSRDVKIRPRTVPVMVHTAISALLSRMNRPGMVKARPPATMEPADMAVWVTLISLTLVLPMSFSRHMESSVTNMMGQGREEAFRATNMEEAVRMMEPMTPITIARTVNCSLKELAFLTLLRSNAIFDLPPIFIFGKRENLTLLSIRYNDCR